MKAKITKYIPIVMMAISVSCSQGDKSVERGYWGKDISKQFSIERESKSKEKFLQVKEPVDWCVYSGKTAETIDLSKPIKEGSGAGIFELQEGDSTERIYFQLVTPDGSALMTERHLPMEGGYNFRDLGGYRTVSGKYVKWGKVFRSDELNMLTSSDLQYLSSIPLRTIVDFRSKPEIMRTPDKLATTVLHTYDLSISPGNMTDQNGLEYFKSRDGEEMMKGINRLFVTDSAIITQYRTFFELLQDETQLPLIFHCTAGKDRTGMGAALFLVSLGVDEETIFADYLLSNQYLKEKYRAVIENRPYLQALFEVRPAYLQAGFKQIKDDHGSIENYLEQTLYVDLDKMKAIYTEE